MIPTLFARQCCGQYQRSEENIGYLKYFLAKPEQRGYNQGTSLLVQIWTRTTGTNFSTVSLQPRRGVDHWLTGAPT